MRICASDAGYNKPMPLYYDEFTDLALDWPMILVGWRGFAGRKLSAEQIISHAADLIGQGTPEQDEIAVLLANTDPSEWQTIDRYLEQITGEKQFDRTLALRKWRLAEWKHRIDAMRLPYSFTDDEDREDDRYSAFYAISDFWRTYHDELPTGERVLPNYGDTTEQMLAEQQAWIEREEISLREEIGTAK